MPDANIPDIGKYRIIELVGEGAMGVVYRAQDSILHRTVAVKVMNDAIARQEELRQRFLHEAQAAASLQHPNVVSIYDLGEVDGHLFIAMEFVQGVDLEQLIVTGEPLSLQAKLDIVIDVLTGLSFAHKRGIVHRDIKPANVRVAEDGRAKIMDFGVAHLANSKLTSTGASLGTPSYMAPEQIVGGKTSPATDIFAVGSVLYELLTGVKPFDGETLQNLFFRIITETPRPIREVKPGLPPALDRIVERAMAKEPAQRYETALEMADQLSAVRSKLSGAGYPETVSLSASVEHAIRQSRQVSHVTTKDSTLPSIGVFVGIAAVALVWWQFGRSTPDTSRADGTRVTASAPTPAADSGQASAPIATRTPTPAPTSAPISAPTSAPSAARPPSPPTASADRPTTRSGPARTAPTPTPPSRTPRAPAQAVASQRPPRSETPSRVAPTSIQPPTTTAPPVVAQTVAPPPVVVAESAPRPSVVPAGSAQPTPEPPRPAPPAPATAADVAPTFEAYARAIESRDIAAIRRVYPGLSSAQQTGFEQFFQATRRINVTFRVTNVESSGSSADARVSGSYEYESASGKLERQPVSFAATLRRDGNAWRLVSLR